MSWGVWVWNTILHVPLWMGNVVSQITRHVQQVCSGMGNMMMWSDCQWVGGGEL